MYTTNYIMKLRAYFLIIFLATLSSCEKFLDVKPRDTVSDEATIVDKVSAETALNGVYSALAAEGYYGTSFQSIGYLSGDNIEWTGSQSQVQEFINHRVNAENSTIASAWETIYNTINRANNVINKVPQVSDPLLTEELRNSIMGEALFIRALAYFDLARTWGGVPLITEPTTSPDENSGTGRNSLEEVFDQVLNDLGAAEPLLPETTNRYRVTRKTVWALKARYYLYRKDWANAETYAGKLIADPDYTLIKPYGAFFKDDVRGTEESIFEIFYNGTTEINHHRERWQPQSRGGTRRWAPNAELVDLLNDPNSGGSRSVLVAKDNQGRWYGDLYYRTPASDPSYIFRIAEMYLIRAEARAEQDKISGAVADLNAVRDRAGLTSTSAETLQQILLAIENERRLEFALEPHRWFDLVRTGRADEVLAVTDPNRLVMPLPVDQLLTDESLEQNAGY